ncbi:MAG: lipoprotein insertase outer membrane protein LolB, partial [Halopseudomonas sp.]
MKPANGQCLMALGCLALFGCSSQSPRPPAPPEQSWNQHQQQLLPLTEWQILGKIRIQTDNDDLAANLNWSQQQDHYRIYIAGPFGQGAVNIEGSEQAGISLDIKDKGHYQAASPEQLLNQQLGWNVPVSLIPYWIRGLPAPQSDHTKTLDPDNRLQQLQQAGWTINYLDYQTDELLHLPRKIKLNHG